jgi:hypothetical protein
MVLDSVLCAPHQLAADFGPMVAQDGVPLDELQLLWGLPPALFEVSPGRGKGGGGGEGSEGGAEEVQRTASGTCWVKRNVSLCNLLWLLPPVGCCHPFQTILQPWVYLGPPIPEQGAVQSIASIPTLLPGRTLT